MGDDRPIFVCGAPRSGTTMLQLMLHAHPRIAIPPETRLVLESYRQRRDFGDLTDPRRRRALAEWITRGKGTYFADLGLDAGGVVEEIVAEADTLGTALGVVFRAYARRFGKPRWGDKRPAYVRNLPILARLFPDAQFVHIIRDGRDCVASLTEMPWHRGGVNQAISAWAQAVDHGRWARRTLGRDSYHEVRYEQLVADPETELRALCTYLGEEYDAAMTAPDRVAGVAVPARKTWHVRTHRPVGSDRVGRWASRLSPQELGLCEAVLGDRLRAQGYVLSGAPRPPAALRLGYERQALRHRLAGLRRSAVRTADRLPWTPAVAARI
ncbi:sulfotransferase family protein [Melissospora conviva]|uniref:sulfotransferase family protein n=1 Tax=Melissospora conviva TaxID=3388432 RepID=UPI003C276295